MLELIFLLLFIMLTTLALYLKLKHRKNRLIFWVAAVIGCSGLTGLQIILEKEIIPAVSGEGNANMLGLIYYMTGGLNLFINTFPYYGILVFYLLYNGMMKYDRWVIAGLSLPIWITLITSTDISKNYLDTAFLSIWGFIYTVTIFFLATYSIVVEKESRLRRHHIAIAFIFCVPLAVLNAFQFASSGLSDRILIFIPYLICISFVVMMFLYVRGVFLGIKKRSIHTIRASTVLIHHSLKNSIGKIKLNSLNIRRSLERQQYDEIEAYIAQLLATHDAMLKTMSKISQAVNDTTVLYKEEVDLADLLDEVVASLRSYPNIQLVTNYSSAILSADRMLLTECLHNICNNAVEAMKEIGEIRIHLEKRKTKALLTIKDTGHGMNNVQIHNVFEPFYSNKQRTRNHFGLGMYQVKKVIDAHDGKIEIKSAPGKGTTVMLTFKLN